MWPKCWYKYTHLSGANWFAHPLPPPLPPDNFGYVVCDLNKIHPVLDISCIETSIFGFSLVQKFFNVAPREPGKIHHLWCRSLTGMCACIQVPFIPLCHTCDQFYQAPCFSVCATLKHWEEPGHGAKLDIYTVFDIPFLLAAHLRLTPNHVPSYNGCKDWGPKLLACKHCTLL